MLTKRCINCGQVSKFLRLICYQCRHVDETKISKGVREYQKLINYFLSLDRSRGVSYADLARQYGLDASNVYKRVNGSLNNRYWNDNK